MSPIFSFDPTAVSASIEVLPKGEYEFEIGQPKIFNRQNQAGNPSFGIRFPLTVVGGDHNAKRIFFSTYFQSTGAQAAAKGFFIAAKGYGKGAAEEKRFNEDHAEADFSVDFEDESSLGEFYKSLAGEHVVGALDVQPSQNDPEQEQQNFKSWRSVASLATQPLRN